MLLDRRVETEGTGVDAPSARSDSVEARTGWNALIPRQTGVGLDHDVHAKRLRRELDEMKGHVRLIEDSAAGLDVTRRSRARARDHSEESEEAMRNDIYSARS